MKQVFITVISMQTGRDLKRMVYHPQGFTFRREERMTSFPIIPVIAECMDRPREIEILAVRQHNTETEDNFGSFVREVETLGLDAGQIKEIVLPEDQSTQSNFNLLMEILHAIPNHCEIQACVTFGTKPVCITMVYALTMADKVLTDVEVTGMYYGEIVRTRGVELDGGAKIYNLVSLLQMNGIVDQLDALNACDRLDSLDRLLDL